MEPFNLTYLPTELIDRIISLVPQRSDLAALRLTNQTLNAISTPYYFATVPLYPEWDEESIRGGLPFPNQVEYHARYFANILDSEKLKQLVRKVEIYHCNPSCDHHPHDCLYEGWMPQPAMSDEWGNLCSRLPELPKLESVSLHFDRHGGGDDDYGNDTILHSPEIRCGELEELLETMKGRIKDLSVRHIQLDRSKPGDGVWDSTVTSALEGLRTLRLSIVHEQPYGESGTVFKVTHCHEEWAYFMPRWLEPAKNLRHLTLYSDLPTGWYPKVDLCSVHFEHLESIALGQFVFSDDRHFEWIADHSATLRELYFDRCSILYQSGATQERHEWLDEHGYQKPLGYRDDGSWYYDCSILPQPGQEHILTLESYPVRWYDAFELFSKHLTHLRTFRFGQSSQWKFGQPNRRDDGREGHPIMPWEAERDLKNEIFEERYLVYNDIEEEDYIVHWKDADTKVLDEKYWSAEELAQFDEHPQCADRDEAALRELLGKLGVTWRGGATS